MFEELIPGPSKEEKKALAAENRERSFMREQNIISPTVEEDMMYHQLKADKGDLTRWQQDLDDSIEELKHDLMNEVMGEEGWEPEVEVQYDKDGKSYYVAVAPMINKQGAVTLISVVKRYLNRNLIMSNLNEEIIYRILRRLKISLVINLGSNYDKYECDPSNLSIVVKMVMDSVEPTLYRSLNNGERRYLNTINKRIEAFTETAQQQRKKGVLGGN